MADDDIKKLPEKEETVSKEASKETREEKIENKKYDTAETVSSALPPPFNLAGVGAKLMKQKKEKERLEKDIGKLTGGILDYLGYVRAVFRTFGLILIALGAFFIFADAPLLKFIPLFILSFAIMSSPAGEISTDEEVGLSVLKMLLGGLMVAFFAYVFWSIAGNNIPLYISLLFIAIGFFLTVPDVKTKRTDAASEFLDEISDLGTEAVKSLKHAIPGLGGASIIFKLMVGFIIIIILFIVFSGVLGFMGSVDLAMGLGKLTTIILGIGMAVFSIIIGLKLGKNINGMILGVFGGIGLAAGAFALGHDMILFVVFSMVVGMGILVSVPVDKAKTFIGIPIVLVALMTTTFAYPDVMGEAVFGVWWPEIDYTIDSTLGPLLQGIRSPLETMGSGYECLLNPVGCYQNYEPETSTKESIRSVEVTSVETIGDTSINSLPKELRVIVTVENRGKEEARDITITPVEPEYAHGTAEGEVAGSVEITCQDGSISDHITGCNISKLLSGEMREFVLNYTITNIEFRGNYIAYGADIQYDLDLTGQVDVMVMDEDYYYKLSKNNQLDRREQITEDTGGPVRLGLALMRNEMPVKDNLKGVPVMLYLGNQGPGTILEIKSARVDISDLEPGENINCTPEKQGKLKLLGLSYYMGKNPEEIASGDSASATCISQIPDIHVEQKTYAITGEVEYTYTHGNQRKINVDFGTPATCTCKDPVTGETKDPFNLYVPCGDNDKNCVRECNGREWDFESCEEEGSEDGGNGKGGAGSVLCTDDDGGLNYFQAGFTQNPDTGNEGNDICSLDNPNEIIEYYCDGDDVKNTTYTCPLGCAADQCNGGEYVIEGCHDYDGGLNYFVRSWANSPGGSLGHAKDDKCADSDEGSRKTEPGDWVAEGYFYYYEPIPARPDLSYWRTAHTYYRCPHGCDCSGGRCACKKSP